MPTFDVKVTARRVRLAQLGMRAVWALRFIVGRARAERWAIAAGLRLVRISAGGRRVR